MLKPDFSKYSLALIQNEDDIFFSSNAQGLRPLLDCLSVYGQTKKNLILHDKVIGLAAARLIVHSEAIVAVYSMVASAPAEKFLGKNGLLLYAEEVVANILTKDRGSLCPGEEIALRTSSVEELTKQIRAMLKRF